MACSNTTRSHHSGPARHSGAPRRLGGAAWLLLAVIAGGCVTENRRAAEAAVDEATQVSRSQVVAAALIDVVVRAVDAGADTTATFVKAIPASVPCASVGFAQTGIVDDAGEPIVDATRVTISFAAADVDAGVEGCALRGFELEGAATVTLVDVAGDPRTLELSWDGLTDGVARLGGTSTVTWSAGSTSHTVSPASTWTRFDSSEAMVGGSRVQTVDETSEQVSIEGIRCAAEGADETLDCSTDVGQIACDDGEQNIDCTTVTSEGVQIRWADPLPDTGRHTVELPDNTVVTLDYARSGDSIEVVGRTGGDRFVFVVTRVSD